MITDKMLEENTTPWGLLSEDMHKAFHKCSVATLEVYNGKLSLSEEWTEALHYPPSSLWVIRKKPVPLTKPDIPWNVLREDFRWAARDEDGSVWVHSSLPESAHTCWVSDSDEVVCLNFLKGVDPGTCDWKDSLVERPK